MVNAPLNKVKQRSQTFHEAQVGLLVGTYSLYRHTAVQAYNVSSELPAQTHQLHYLTSRKSFSPVLLKLSNIYTLAEFFSIVKV